jgi:hypothetical protein
MKDIRQKINEYFWNAGSEHNQKVEKFIEEIIKPLAEEAFEAGYMRGVVEYEMKEKEKKYPNCMTYIDQKFTSNKQ